eukprot:950100-Amphidinium_carterae.3
MTTLCDWRNSDVDAILRLQKEKDPMMNQVYTEHLKKRWTGDGADQYRTHVFVKQVAGNQLASINLMCFRCLGGIKNEPMKYYQEQCGKAFYSPQNNASTELSASYGALSPDCGQLGQVYASSGCAIAPHHGFRLPLMQHRDWLYGRPSPSSTKTQCHCPNYAARWKWGTGRQERWVMLYNGDEAEPDYYVWGNGHTHRRLTSSDICKDNNVSLRKGLQAIGAIDKATEDRVKLHMKWERKKCADPRLGDFPAFEPICMDDRLSVRHIGQDVHIGYKDPRSRSLTSVELIQICEVMLALVDPKNYPTSSKPMKKTSEAAATCRSKWYTTFVDEVTNQTVVKYTQALSSDDDGGDMHL